MARFRAIGADGCRAGWVVAASDVDPYGTPGAVTITVVPDFAAVVAHHPDRIVVDMPIGLPEAWAPGGRICDVEARALLGPGRGSSVFPAPPRPALDLASFDAPGREELGLTLQAWLILPRIREVDAIVSPELQDPSGTARPTILEAHPELIFSDMAGGSPVAGTKRSAEGRLRRRVLLEERFGRPIPVVVPAGAEEDDVLDALACLWVAAAPKGSLSAVPRGFVPRDPRGLQMRIWRRDAVPAASARPRSDESALLDRILDALGSAPGVSVRRWSGGGTHGYEAVLEHEGARVVIDLDRTPGLERLSRHWSELRSAADERPTLLLHLVKARHGRVAAVHGSSWDFLAARMADDLASAGRMRGDAWDAIRLGWGPAAADPVDDVVARTRAALGLEPRPPEDS